MSALNIIASIKNNDESVFQMVFNEYHERIYFYILKKTKSAYLAEEVVQLTFIKFWNYRATLKEELTVYTQLFRIATTTLIDLLRKQNNAALLVKELAKNAADKKDNYTIDTINFNEAKKQLSSAMNNMPVMRRKVFEMSRLEGLTYNEIAEHLSISPKTVENHIALAIKQIRRVLPYLVAGITVMNSFLFLVQLGVLSFLNVLTYSYFFLA